MKIIILGATGMIGSTIFRVLSEESDWDVWGTIRSPQDRRFFSQINSMKLIDGIDARNIDSVMKVFAEKRPDVVINCIGLTKHRREASDLIQSLNLNSVFPHRLSSICEAAGSRLIHISTDCVFMGAKGGYVESDFADAQDYYGKSKNMGEVISANHAITLRVSTIGHEINSKYGLLEWFLSQSGNCIGFSNAFFSGMPTVVFAKVIQDFVISRPNLNGLLHVATNSISKLELLKLIAKTYNKEIEIIPDDNFLVDRSLDGSKFSAVTGYIPQSWEDMINLMHTAKIKEIN